ncbi:MAG: hypothetical protein PHN51_06825 [Candidatus Nanopelagicales bacterium]|nr:hypothetical protein [Candidatus Nanopelagicales bacterium]
MTDLFIGVVSHLGSRFSQNQEEGGLAFGLARALEMLGRSIEIQVNTLDAWSPEVLPLSPEVGRASAFASLDFEQTWDTYLNEGVSTSITARFRRSGEFQARRLKLGLAARSSSFASSSVAATRRLLNIELSHLHLWREGLASGAQWILILEDDGGCADLGDLSAGLDALLTADGADWLYANISASFDATQLGVRHLLTPSSLRWKGGAIRTIQSASRPISNTVCAIVYRREFLDEVVSQFELLPLEPVIPIDFKLNAALMALYANGKIKAGDCLQVEPAPIVQMSMHEMG